MFSIGIPSALQNLFNVISLAVLTRFATAYGSEAVSAMGIANKVYLVPLYTAMGIALGLMPLVSYNYSSGNSERLKTAVRYGLRIAVAFVAVVAVLLCVFAPQVVRLFIKNDTIIEYGTHYLRGLSLGLPFFAIDILIVSSVFNACGMGGRALLFALLRAGRVLRFVSTSVMGGFISGICCTIILMQLPKLMGGTAGTGELPELVRQSLESYETYFLQNELGWNFSFIPLLVIAAWVSGVVLLATLLLRRQVGVLRGMLALVLVLLYPLAGSLIHIMVAGAAVHDLMIYGLLYALILPLALASFAATHADEMGSLRSALQSLMSWIVIAAMALTAYNYIVTDNKAYLKMALGFTQIEAYSNRLATMIQSVPGYSPSLAVVLVGSSNGDALLDVTPELSEITLTGALNMGTYRTQYSYGNLLNRFSALPNYVYLDDMPEEVSSAIAGVSETMPAYPQEGCVQISGDYIVVRLN